MKDLTQTLSKLSPSKGMAGSTGLSSLPALRRPRLEGQKFKDSLEYLGQVNLSGQVWDNPDNPG